MEERHGSNESGQALAGFILLFVVAGVVWTLYAAVAPAGRAESARAAAATPHREWLPGSWRVDG